MSEDTISLLSNLASLFPEGFLIVVTATGIAVTVYVLRLALPSRMMRSLDKTLYDVLTFYKDAFEVPLWNRAITDSKEDIMLAQRLVAYVIFLLIVSQLNSQPGLRIGRISCEYKLFSMEHFLYSGESCGDCSLGILSLFGAAPGRSNVSAMR